MDAERSQSDKDDNGSMITVPEKPSAGPSVLISKKPRMVFGMPVYNQPQENKLMAAADPIRTQTWRDFSLVIVDDTSTDGTWGLVQKNSRQDSRVGAFRHKERLGFIRNFRHSFEHSQLSDLFP